MNSRHLDSQEISVVRVLNGLELHEISTEKSQISNRNFLFWDLQFVLLRRFGWGFATNSTGCSRDQMYFRRPL